MYLKGLVQFTKDDEYYTPVDFVKQFGDFEYDPATTKEKAQEFGIVNYDTIDTNGLVADWTKYKKIWINPPFTLKHLFLHKAVETYNQTKADIYILFPLGFLTTQRFANTKAKGTIYLPNFRINFESGLGKKVGSPAFGSIVLKLSNKWSVEQIYKK